MEDVPQTCCSGGQHNDRNVPLTMWDNSPYTTSEPPICNLSDISDCHALQSTGSDPLFCAPSAPTLPHIHNDFFYERTHAPVAPSTSRLSNTAYTTHTCATIKTERYIHHQGAPSTLPSVSYPQVLDECHSVPLRPHSTPATLIWLAENYELGEGVCIPRNTLYQHYVDFCARNSMQPVNAASFGKIIRQQFSQLTTRRLGTRGQSRYHYYGIAIKETSIYFEPSYSKKSGIENHQQNKGKNHHHTHQSFATNLATSSGGPGIKMARLQLPAIMGTASISHMPSQHSLIDFPTIRTLKLPKYIDKEQISTFLTMYRAHCQRFVDAMARGHLEEVKVYVQHFWLGVPSHIAAILDSPLFLSVVGLCDSIFYRDIAQMFVPSFVQPVLQTFARTIRVFTDEFETWLQRALNGFPQNLQIVKLETSRRFLQNLRRRLSLNHLAQASRMIANSRELNARMLHDWKRISLAEACHEATAIMTSQTETAPTAQYLLKCCQDFEVYLERGSSLDTYMVWMDVLFETCTTRHGSSHSTNKLKEIETPSKLFVFFWSTVSARIGRQLSVQQAHTFGSFHLLKLLLEEYARLLSENVLTTEIIRELYTNIASNTSPSMFAIQRQEHPVSVSNDISNTKEDPEREHTHLSDNKQIGQTSWKPNIQQQQQAEVRPEVGTGCGSKPEPIGYPVLYNQVSTIRQVRDYNKHVERETETSGEGGSNNGFEHRDEDSMLNCTQHQRWPELNLTYEVHQTHDSC